MTSIVLALNAGSSSLKFSSYRPLADASDFKLLCTGEVEGIGEAAHFVARGAVGETLADRASGGPGSQDSALAAVLDWLDERFKGQTIAAAGHRVVHGGDAFPAPVRIDDAVLRTLERFVPLAPSHQPHNLAAIKALQRSHPQLPQVACFDTAFHQSQTALARAYALPRALTESGIRRYGFHGLSYEFIAGVLPDLLDAAADGRVIVAHLGHGASMCALRHRRSVATTMGFTALDGLPMGRRSGALDPGIVPYLVRERGMTIGEVEDLLYHKSGLLGVSGLSDDMRDLLANDAQEAAEAVDLFCYRIGRELGSLAAALGGLDVLVFTGGIGEHAAAVRSKVCGHAQWLGVEIDAAANAAQGSRIDAPSSRVAVLVIPTDEDLAIARHTLRLVHGATTAAPPSRAASQ